MKKSTLMKLAFIITAMFLFSGTYAQTNGGAGVEGSADVTFTTGGTITIVAGTTIPLYALPDPVYHSSWSYGTNWTLTAGFIWHWSVTTGNPAHFTFAPAADNTADNYVEITADAAAAGAYVISVTEQASAAYGSCTGAATNQNITVVATPDAALSETGSETFCIGDVGIPAAINATISGGWQNYRLVWSLEIATLGAGLAKDEWFDTDKSTSLGAVLAYAENYTTAVPEAVAASGAHSILSIAGGFTVINSKPTVYTYTLTSINDQALRHGDYIGFGGDYGTPAAADFTYNAIGETYTIQINPAPTTGPIYHIPATWAL